MEDWLKCLIAFILGWIIARMMGEGFSVGGESDDELTRQCKGWPMEHDKYPDGNIRECRCSHLMAKFTEKECNSIGDRLQLWETEDGINLPADDIGALFCDAHANKDPNTLERCLKPCNQIQFESRCIDAKKPVGNNHEVESRCEWDMNNCVDKKV